MKKKEYIVEKSDVSKDCLIIKNPINMTEIEEFKEGLFTIQDQSSILVSEILNPKENSSVLIYVQHQAQRVLICYKLCTTMVKLLQMISQKIS